MFRSALKLSRFAGAASAAAFAGFCHSGVAKNEHPHNMAELKDEAGRVTGMVKDKMGRVVFATRHALGTEQKVPAPVEEAEWKVLKEGVPGGREGPSHGVDSVLPRMPASWAHFPEVPKPINGSRGPAHLTMEMGDGHHHREGPADRQRLV